MVTTHENFYDKTKKEQEIYRKQHIKNQLTFLLPLLERFASEATVWCCFQEVEGAFERHLAKKLHKRGWSHQIFYQSSRSLLSLLLNAPQASFRSICMTDVQEHVVHQLGQMDHPWLGHIACANFHLRVPKYWCPAVPDMLERSYARITELPDSLVMMGDFNMKGERQRAWGGDWATQSHLRAIDRKFKKSMGQHFDYPSRGPPDDYPPNDHIFIWAKGRLDNLLALYRGTVESMGDDFPSDHMPLAISLT
jgi:endonuclease/exonuclease/phosphatase family metal-dependent hydrolase